MIEKYDNRTKHPLYRTYINMIQRCYTKHHPNYSSYGARGIKVCDEWLGKQGFWNFASAMKERPINFSIERKDNDSSYSPSNCIWASKTGQVLNRRLNKNNKSGHVGVHFNKQRQKWRADIKRDGKQIYLGTFGNKADAIAARQDVERER